MYLFEDVYCGPFDVEYWWNNRNYRVMVGSPTGCVQRREDDKQPGGPCSGTVNATDLVLIWSVGVGYLRAIVPREKDHGIGRMCRSDNLRFRVGDVKDNRHSAYRVVRIEQALCG